MLGRENAAEFYRTSAFEYLLATMTLVLTIVVCLVCLALLTLARRLPSVIRSAVIGALVGLGIVFPIAFLLSFFRVFAPPASVGGAYVTALIWMPVSGGIVGLVGGIMMGIIRRRKQLTTQSSQPSTRAGARADGGSP